MTRLDDRLHATGEEIQQAAYRVPDNRSVDTAPRRVGTLGMALGAIAILALVAFPLVLRGGDAGRSFGGPPADDETEETIDETEDAPERGARHAHASGGSVLPEGIVIELKHSVTEAHGRAIADDLHNAWPAIEEAVWVSAEDVRERFLEMVASSIPPLDPDGVPLQPFFSAIHVTLFANDDANAWQEIAEHTMQEMAVWLEDSAVAVSVQLNGKESSIVYVLDSAYGQTDGSTTTTTIVAQTEEDDG